MRRAMVFGLAAALTTPGLSTPSPAHSQTCSASVTAIDFGDPDVLGGSPDDASGSVTVTCSRIPIFSVVKICPSIGAGSGGSSGAGRLLTGPSGRTLAYQLYQDSGRTSAWGALDDPGLGGVPAILLNGGFLGSASATRPLYGRVFAGQNGAAPGAYASSFSGETAFTWSTLLIGATSSCSGFVGSGLMRPSFVVMASPAPHCGISSTDLDFGVAGVISQALVGQTALSVTCTQGTPYVVALDGGSASAGSATRQLQSSAGHSVAYNLYQDAARTTVWSDRAQSGGTGTGGRVAHAVYGQVPRQDAPPPGTYADRIIATVTY